jgi:hypothetical protein
MDSSGPPRTHFEAAELKKNKLPRQSLATTSPACSGPTRNESKQARNEQALRRPPSNERFPFHNQADKMTKEAIVTKSNNPFMLLLLSFGRRRWRDCSGWDRREAAGIR